MFDDDGMEDVAGETNGSDWKYVRGMMGDGLIHPEKLITHRLPFSDLERGLCMMRDKTEPYIKVMVHD